MQQLNLQLLEDARRAVDELIFNQSQTGDQAVELLAQMTSIALSNLYSPSIARNKVGEIGLKTLAAMEQVPPLRPMQVFNLNEVQGRVEIPVYKQELLPRFDFTQDKKE